MKKNLQKKLKDWLPQEFFGEFMDTSTSKYLDWIVVEDYGFRAAHKKYHPFKHRNIYNWCVITNGEKHRAVGWNENPSIGWSFPNKSIKSKKWMQKNLQKKIKF